MQFQHTADWIVGASPHTGKPKTQTRRLAKPIHSTGRVQSGALEYIPVGFSVGDIVAVRTNGRDIYAVGKTYSVQPGRGQKAIARIRILSIRKEDVRDISDADLKAEGFTDRVDFWLLWVMMHDFSAWELPESGTTEAWKPVLMQRPAERYQAWVLEFERIDAVSQPKKTVFDKDRFPAPGERSYEDAEAPVFAGGGKNQEWSAEEITLEMRVAQLERTVARLKMISDAQLDKEPPDLSLKREPELSTAQEETLVSLLTALYEYVYGFQYPPVETVVRDLMEDLKALMPDLYNSYLRELGARLLARQQAGLNDAAE